MLSIGLVSGLRALLAVLIVWVGKVLASFVLEKRGALGYVNLLGWDLILLVLRDLGSTDRESLSDWGVVDHWLREGVLWDRGAPVSDFGVWGLDLLDWKSWLLSILLNTECVALAVRIPCLILIFVNCGLIVWIHELTGLFSLLHDYYLWWLFG